MKKFIKKFVLILPMIALLVVPAFAVVAQFGTGEAGDAIGDIDIRERPPMMGGELSDVLILMQTIINLFFWFLMALTVLFLIYAAYLFLSASGDESKIGRARSMIIYAIIAVVVAVLAQSLFWIVINTIGAEDDGGGAAIRILAMLG